MITVHLRVYKKCIPDRRLINKTSTWKKSFESRPTDITCILCTVLLRKRPGLKMYSVKKQATNA